MLKEITYSKSDNEVNISKQMTNQFITSYTRARWTKGILVDIKSEVSVNREGVDDINTYRVSDVIIVTSIDLLAI